RTCGAYAKPAYIQFLDVRWHHGSIPGSAHRKELCLHGTGIETTVRCDGNRPEQNAISEVQSRLAGSPAEEGLKRYVCATAVPGKPTLEIFSRLRVAIGPVSVVQDETVSARNFIPPHAQFDGQDGVRGVSTGM